MHVCNTHKNVRSARAVYVHQKNVRATGECVYTSMTISSGTLWEYSGSHMLRLANTCLSFCRTCCQTHHINIYPIEVKQSFPRPSSTETSPPETLRHLHAIAQHLPLSCASACTSPTVSRAARAVQPNHSHRWTEFSHGPVRQGYHPQLHLLFAEPTLLLHLSLLRVSTTLLIYRQFHGKKHIVSLSRYRSHLISFAVKLSNTWFPCIATRWTLPLCATTRALGRQKIQETRDEQSQFEHKCSPFHGFTTAIGSTNIASFTMVHANAQANWCELCSILHHVAEHRRKSKLTEGDTLFTSCIGARGRLAKISLESTKTAHRVWRVVALISSRRWNGKKQCSCSGSWNFRKFMSHVQG